MDCGSLLYYPGKGISVMPVNKGGMNVPKRSRRGYREENDKEYTKESRDRKEYTKRDRKEGRSEYRQADRSGYRPEYGSEYRAEPGPGYGSDYRREYGKESGKESGRERDYRKDPRRGYRKKRGGKEDAWIGTVVLIAAVSVFLLSGWKLYGYYREYKAGSDEYNSLKESYLKHDVSQGEEEYLQGDDAGLFLQENVQSSEEHGGTETEGNSSARLTGSTAPEGTSGESPNLAGTLSGTADPAGTQPGTASPAGTQTGTASPAGTQTGTASPADTQPGIASPAGTQPGTSTSAGVQNGTANPSEAQPGTATSAGAQAGTADPSAAVSETGDPAVLPTGMENPAGTQPGTAASAETQKGTENSSGEKTEEGNEAGRTDGSKTGTAGGTAGFAIQPGTRISGRLLKDYTTLENPETVGARIDEAAKIAAKVDGNLQFLPVLSNHVDFDALHEINEDIIGWICLDALDLSYPVVQAEDNDYYLHRTFERKDNFAGCLFLNCDNSKYFSDQNTVIYGHNMKDGSMFGLLTRLQDQSLYESCPYFWIFTEDRIFQYRMYSCSVVSTQGDPYRIRFLKEDFEKFLKDSRRSSLVDNTGISLTTEDHVVTLSTCTMDDTTRFIVQGVLEQIYMPQ